MALLKFVRLPNGWIEDYDLKRLSWSRNGVDALTALMTLMVIAQHADQETGEARMTYDDLQRATGLSRTTIAGGLGILEGWLVDRKGQSNFTLLNFDQYGGYAFLPAKPLYNARGRVSFFQEFKRRKAVELDALKLYLLIVSRRDRNTNLAHITYDKIVEYTGMDRDNIKTAISILAANGMVHVEHLPRQISQYGFSSAYRLVHLDAYRHMGTIGQNLDITDFAPGFKPTPAADS